MRPQVQPHFGQPDLRAWAALILEASNCARDVYRQTGELERCAKLARSSVRPPKDLADADPFGPLIRLSLQFCIETSTGKKFACEELMTAARAALLKLPDPERPYRADIDG